MQKKSKAAELGHLLVVKEARRKMEILFQQIAVLSLNCRGRFPEPPFLADFLAKVRTQNVTSDSYAAQLFTRGGSDETKRGWLVRNALPSNIISFLCSKIPRLDKDILCLGDVEIFRQHIEDIASAGYVKREHSEAAEDYYRNNRPRLQKWIRSYYSVAQQAPSDLDDFPLVVGENYLVGKEPLFLDPAQETQLLVYSDDFFDDNLFPNVAADQLYFFGHSYREFRSAYREKLSGKKPGTFNGYSYRLMKVEPTDKFPRLHFARSRYFSYINTCEVRAFEAAYFKEILHEQNPLNMCHSERCLFRRDPKSIFSLTNRNAIAGVNTFTIVVDQKTDLAFYLRHVRSEHEVGEAILTTHVVPAGTFQPLIPKDVVSNKEQALASGAWTRDFSLIQNIVREFLEECLDLEDEIKDANQHGNWREKEVIKRPYHALYDALLRQKQAKAWFLGIGFDRLTEKPELLTALVIDVSLAQKLKWNTEGYGEPILLTEDVLRTIIERGTDQWLSAGMACVQLVNKHFRRLRHCLSD